MIGNPRLALALVGMALLGCSKSNEVDINEGQLAAGSECVAQAEDPCAGACIGGICRMPCGVNRECPSGARCLGDGDHSGCVPESFGHVNLLEDCSGGCVTPLAEFGREGHFYRCDAEFSYEMMLDFTASRPDIEPVVLCSRVFEKAWSVKDDVAWTAGDSCSWTHLGTAGDKLIQHTCMPSYFDDIGNVTGAGIGWRYTSGGDTYWLTALYGNPYLYKFQPESVGELPSGCSPYFGSYNAPSHPEDPAACKAPTFPPIGATASKHAGFWVECPPVFEQPNQYSEYDIDSCASLTWGEGQWASELPTRSAVDVRGDGYGVEMRWPFIAGQSCTNAFRMLGDDSGRVVVLTVQGGVLDLQVEGWDGMEHAGESFLRRREKTAANSGALLRRIPKPAEFSVDPCGGSRPLFGF